MTTRRLTLAICAAVILGLVGYDIWVYREPTPGDTISELTLEFGRRFSLIPFGIGVLGGHFFFPRRQEAIGMTRRQSVIVLVWCSGLVAIRDVVALLVPHHVPTAAAFIAGVVAGAFLWGQTQEA